METQREIINWDAVTRFRLRGEPIRTPSGKGQRLTVDTDKGPVEMNAPLWVRIERFVEDGERVVMAVIPDIIAERAGLLEKLE